MPFGLFALWDCNHRKMFKNERKRESARGPVSAEQGRVGGFIFFLWGWVVDQNVTITVFSFCWPLHNRPVWEALGALSSDVSCGGEATDGRMLGKAAK